MEIPDIDYKDHLAPFAIRDFLVSDSCMKGVVEDAYKYASGELQKFTLACPKTLNPIFRKRNIPPSPPEGLEADFNYTSESQKICCLSLVDKEDLEIQLREAWVAHVLVAIEGAEIKAGKWMETPKYQDVVAMRWNEYDPFRNPEKLRPSIKVTVRNYY